jgi:hypothetical protein
VVDVAGGVAVDGDVARNRQSIAGTVRADGNVYRLWLRRK